MLLNRSSLTFHCQQITIRSDNGGECVNRGTDDNLRKNSIKHQVSVPYCPSQNGVAERKNRSLLYMFRRLLRETNLLQRFWGDAINSTNLLQIRFLTGSTNKTPYKF